MTKTPLMINSYFYIKYIKRVFFLSVEIFEPVISIVLDIELSAIIHVVAGLDEVHAAVEQAAHRAEVGVVFVGFHFRFVTRI
jgi:hypothetical protein